MSSPLEFHQSIIDLIKAHPEFMKIAHVLQKSPSQSKIIDTETMISILGSLDRVTRFTKKCNITSNELREQGNIFFQNRFPDYFMAMKLYNECISYAEKNSVYEALGYANRSAIYYTWGEWQAAIDNINLAKNHAKLFPRVKDKLIKRENICKFRLSNSEPETQCVNSLLDLTSPAHKQVPFISDGLKLATSKRFGRHVVATKDFHIGDVIINEKPVVLSLHANSMYVRCLNCTSENKYFLIPCGRCVRAMFCSKKCRDEASVFHKYECDSIDGIYSVLNNLQIAALRLVLKLFSNDVEYKKFAEFLKTNNVKGKNAFNIDYSKYSLAEKFKALHSLHTPASVNHSEKLFQFTVAAACAMSFLKKNIHIQKLFQDKEKYNNFYMLFLHNLQTLSLNTITHKIVEPFIHGDRSPFTHFTDGVYTCIPLLNHSCVPNVFSQYIGKSKQVAVIVEKEIKAGDQIFVNYLSHGHAYKPREERLNELQPRGVNCECFACRKNYGLVNNLTIAEDLPTVVDDIDMNRLIFSFDVKYAEQCIPILTNFLSKYLKPSEEPSQQVCYAQLRLQVCYTLISEMAAFFIKHRYSERKGNAF